MNLFIVYVDEEIAKYKEIYIPIIYKFLCLVVIFVENLKYDKCKFEVWIQL